MLVAEGRINSGAVSITYGCVFDAIEKLVGRQGANESGLQYYVTNGHGDVTELRDSSGNLLNSYSYDIWGNPLTVQESIPNPLRYSGEYWDSDTKLQYLRARWYDPATARLIGEDAYEGEYTNPLTLNLYTYVLNNPLIYHDPSGHDAVVLTNPDLAFGLGHTSALIENSNSQWYYFYWGDRNVQTVLVDDVNALKSIDKLNEWGQNKGLAGFGKVGDTGYASSTYIMGDFNASVDKALSIAKDHPFNGKNKDYALIGSSCLDITTQVLSLGTLYNGTSAANFFDGIWSDETTGDQIPNNAAKEIRSVFYNNAYTVEDYRNQLLQKYSKYENMGWFKSKINFANFNMYRIDILLGRNPK
ncbi:RHS repeat-associated core domain-containing protein [Paenibacillus sp. alder61]|uniref:RHS repeat-associated core domain-containing protein n=1 Tax=Paenibacillus sp. alder61 TaxID=2862948 RepID=UPI001CD479FA|nr:RHS repeat-associated core domain-containing protein [Paenibacillus sp. alder61]MCA1291742.1 RHS repeat-associated core domain-containing protein [Paenibacillus sp. alder61]